MENKINSMRQVLIIAMMLLCQVCNAQLVKGLSKEKITKADLEKIFGQTIIFQVHEDTGNAYAKFQDGTIVTTSEGFLAGFEIKVNTYICFEHLVPGGIKVGDSIDKVINSPICQYEQTSTNRYIMYPLGRKTDDTPSVRVNNGIITEIDYYCPD